MPEEDPSPTREAKASTKGAEYLKKKLERHSTASMVAGERPEDATGTQKGAPGRRVAGRKPGEFRPLPTQSAFSRKQFDVEEAFGHMGSVQMKQLKYALGGFPAAAPQPAASVSPRHVSIEAATGNVKLGQHAPLPTAQPARGNGFLHRSWRTDAFLHQRIVEQQRRELRQKSTNVKWTTLLFHPAFHQSGERQGALKVVHSPAEAKSGEGGSSSSAPNAAAGTMSHAEVDGWMDGAGLEAQGKSVDLVSAPAAAVRGHPDAHFQPAPPSPSRIRPSTAPSRRKPNDTAQELPERKATAASSSLAAQREAWKWVLDDSYRQHPSGGGQRLNNVNGISPVASVPSSSVAGLCLRGQHLEPPTPNPKKVTTTTSSQRPWSAGVVRPTPPQPTAATTATNQATTRRPQSAKVRSEAIDSTFPRGAVEIPRHVANNSEWLREGIHPAHSSSDTAPYSYSQQTQRSGMKPLFPANTVPLVRALAGPG